MKTTSRIVATALGIASLAFAFMPRATTAQSLPFGFPYQLVPRPGYVNLCVSGSPTPVPTASPTATPTGATPSPTPVPTSAAIVPVACASDGGLLVHTTNSSGGGGTYTAPPVQAVTLPNSFQSSFPTFPPYTLASPLAVTTAAPAPTPIPYTTGSPIPAFITNASSFDDTLYNATTGQAAIASSFAGSACVAYSGTPSLTAGQVSPCLTDLAGNQLVNLVTALPPGANNIGLVGLAAGSNTIGTVNGGTGFPTPIAWTTASPEPAFITNQQPIAAPGTSATTAAAVQGVTGGIPLPQVPGATTGSGSDGALNAAVVIPTYGYGSVGFTISGTFVATISFQGSTDGGSTYPWTITAANTSTGTASSATAVGSFKANIAPYDHVRLIATAYTSGSATINWSAALSPYGPGLTGYSTAYQSICSTNTTVCVNPGTPAATGNALGNGINTQSQNLLYNGTNADLAIACPSTVAINVTSATTTQLVALVASKVIYVCGFQYSANGTSPTVQFEYGTGTNCGTGTVALTGAVAPTSGTVVTSPPQQNGTMRAIASNALCLVSGGTSPSIQGYLNYAQF